MEEYEEFRLSLISIGYSEDIAGSIVENLQKMETKPNKLEEGSK